MSSIEMIITSRERDLGGFSVRRILPYATHRMVGPFIFFDHMGPAYFEPESGIDVRPHPHINLATVTYLFDGKIHHRDSLGSDQLIEPGAINWMTSGKGIVHSERTPPEVRHAGGKLNGIQCWVALPEKYEEVDPSFKHHAADSLPEFDVNGVQMKILLGHAYGHASPVGVHSDFYYVDVHIPKGKTLLLPNDGRESAAYVVSGKVRAEENLVEGFSMIVLKNNESLILAVEEDSHVLLLGGSTVGKRYIYWNFVSSSEERIEEVKKQWAMGPGYSPRFGKIEGDDRDFIPLPPEVGQNPKGTIL